MKVDRGELVAALAPGVALGAAALLLAGAFASTLDAGERAALAAVLAPRGALLLAAWLGLAAVLGTLARRAWRRTVVEPARLAEAARALAVAEAGGDAPPLVPAGPAGVRAMAEAFNALAAQRAALRDDMARQVRDASRDVEQERGRLAALMSRLPQSVVVCNLDGRVLLYNRHARRQFQTLSAAPSLAGGAELIGLGRSIYAVLDRPLVDHALDSVRQRLRRGVADPSAQFVTHARGGRLLRVQVAPVRAIGTEGEGDVLDGFVLMLDDITRDFAEETLRDRLLHDLAEASRASLGALQAALDMLDYEDLEAPVRERFMGVVRDEVRAMSERIRAFGDHVARARKTRWPLEDVLGADLCAAAARRIEAAHGCRAVADEVDQALWLWVDGFSLLQALTHLAGRVAQEHAVRLVRLRLAAAPSSSGPRAHLDLVWTGYAVSTETAIGWETEPMQSAGALTVRDVIERHDGAFWFERERARHEAFFRFLLPQAAGAEEVATPSPDDGRPESYDFDLFARGADSGLALADRPLAELGYTVFDTETTGLDPARGDEIVQIGAVRIVAGKLRREERFEQLVDPRRDIPAASIPIHGIRPEMVAGQPTIDVVLPAFHAFAHDTVLVAHNAAFDMRFLQMKEAAVGVVFDQPVLDTLLLSAVLHPSQETHRLEEIARRLGVPVLARHTALGDALVTAEAFLRMVPLLADMGIRTLEQARQAQERTYYARVKY